jgi:hypothetical protein
MRAREVTIPRRIATASSSIDLNAVSSPGASSIRYILDPHEVLRLTNVCKSRARYRCTFVHVREADDWLLQELMSSNSSVAARLPNAGADKYFQADLRVHVRMLLSAVNPGRGRRCIFAQWQGWARSSGRLPESSLATTPSAGSGGAVTGEKPLPLIALMPPVARGIDVN